MSMSSLGVSAEDVGTAEIFDHLHRHIPRVRSTIFRVTTLRSDREAGGDAGLQIYKGGEDDDVNTFAGPICIESPFVGDLGSGIWDLGSPSRE